MGRMSQIPDLIPKDARLHNRFAFFIRLGGGAFGQVYRGMDMNRNEKVIAVKVEPPFQNKDSTDPRRMIVEQKVMISLRGKRHIPTFYASGKTETDCAYLIMQLLGETLDDLRCKRTNFHFSLSTTIRASQQIICALEYLHNAGWLHRDIKPCNTCIGRKDRRTVYLIDFGLCRQYKRNGVLREARKRTHFRGTLRYASIRMHARQEIGPSDDIQSWLYSMIEIYANNLPWMTLDTGEKIHECKKQTTLKNLCKNMPAPFYTVCSYISSLSWDQPVNYDKIHFQFRSCLSSIVEYTAKFDWEIDEEPTDAFSASCSISQKRPIFVK